MKHLTEAEISELAIDELQDYADYLKRVEAHEKGAGGELRRIRAELVRRGKPLQRAAPAAVTEVDGFELEPVDPWWPHASEAEMNEWYRQLEEQQRLFMEQFGDGDWLR